MSGCHLWPMDRREQVARICLGADPEANHNTVTRMVNEAGHPVSRETVRKIRDGTTWIQVLPDLPRLESTSKQRCWNCLQISSDRKRCTLEVPESITTNGRLAPFFATQCSFYVRSDGSD